MSATAAVVIKHTGNDSSFLTDGLWTKLQGTPMNKLCEYFAKKWVVKQIQS